jgi:hypothetical protein
MIVGQAAGTDQPKLGPKRRGWSWKLMLSRAAFLAFALLFWGFATQGNTLGAQAALFAAASACILGAFRPHYGAGMLLMSFMALGMAGTVNTINVWNATAMLLGSVGTFLVLHRRHLALAWIGSSFMFWAMTSAVHWFIYVALGLVFLGLATSVAFPFMSRKRGNGPERLSHLANGPLIEVPDRAFHFKSGTKLLKVTLPFSCFAVFLGGVLWLTGSRAGGLTLIVTGAVLGFSFALSAWFNSHMCYRVDSRGIYSFVLLREKHIPWTEVGGLFMRYSAMPGLGQYWVYYCIHSTKTIIAFPHTIVGAAELRDLIQKATGMDWPESEIKATLS